MKDLRLECRPIGVIRTPFTSKYSAPRQPATSRTRTVGVITLNARFNFEQALTDLKGFDYIWILFWFHENENWKPMVLPPVGDRKKRGVLATRSPHRPNPIGLSLCKLLEVKGRTIRVQNPDMLDGTPILDIKPYLPHAESHPRARPGWIGTAHEKEPVKYPVVLGPKVRKALSDLPKSERSDMMNYLNGTLARDPFPHTYRRIKRQSDGSYVIALKRWRFSYTVARRRVLVTEMSGPVRSDP